MPGCHDLSLRSFEAEVMDDPALSPQLLEQALHELAVINRWLNGYPPSLCAIARLLPVKATSFSLLDVGCGAGDTLIAIARWARSQKMEAELLGIELSPVSVEVAAKNCRAWPEIQVMRADLFDLPGSRRFDLVHSALLLHHLGDDEHTVAGLSAMRQLACVGVVANDLHRHPVACHAIRLLTRLLSKSPVVKHDAPLSVKRGFRRQELAELASRAGLKDVEIRWHAAFRWSLSAKPQ